MDFGNHPLILPAAKNQKIGMEPARAHPLHLFDAEFLNLVTTELLMIALHLPFVQFDRVLTHFTEIGHGQVLFIVEAAGMPHKDRVADKQATQQTYSLDLQIWSELKKIKQW